MTEKENKAIEYLKEEIKSLEKAKIEFSNEIEDKGWLQKNINELDNDIFYKNTLLNLIEKLKKENEEKTTIILAGAEKVKSLEKKIEELKNKVIKRDNDIIYLEETAEKEFLTKQEVKANYIPKDKIRAKLEGLKLIDEYEAPNGWESERMYSEEILEELLKEE